jgi:ferritin
MLNNKMLEALNGQINAELSSWYLYESMATWFKANQWDGFAHWMRTQAGEELKHANKIRAYVEEHGHAVTLAALEAPKNTWKGPLDAFKDSLAHEKTITARINKLTDLAQETRDHATNIFLQWFVTEQVEEEAQADAAVSKLTMIGDSVGGLFQLDHRFGKRGE